MRHYHIISRVSIYLLALVLIGFGIFSFNYPRELLIYVPVELPGGIKLAYIVGGGFILVGLSFMFNQYVKLVGYVFAGLLLIFIITVHVPNYLNAGVIEMKRQALINLLKDTAIMSFSLHIAAGAHHQHFHLEESD